MDNRHAGDTTIMMNWVVIMHIQIIGDGKLTDLTRRYDVQARGSMMAVEKAVEQVRKNFRARVVLMSLISATPDDK